jgi:L-alanine-DL-glutamate epimerase-like enolase superfamily enzyme
MNVESITASALQIPLRLVFRHASAERTVTQAVWVVARARGGAVGVGEGCPREYVTGETLATAERFVAARREEWCDSIRDMATLRAWIRHHREAIDRNPSAWAAVELSLLDLIGQVEGRALESLLGLPALAGRFCYTAVLGDAATDAFAAQLAAYRQAGFRDFKIKLGRDLASDRAKVRALVAAGIAPQCVRADANNRWTDADAAIGHLEALDYPFRAIEEPLQPRDYAGMRRVSATLEAKIVLDESLLRIGDLDAVAADADRWIVNVRVSKMGGALRSLELAQSARRRGLAMILGSHVGETSVLTRAALALANGFRDGVVAHEGAFGTHLLYHDPVEPPLMFGAGGIVDVTALGIANAPGLGLQPRPAAREAV